jgi:catechol 2,3-dioxygenase-like lactoylglutathione lyase family enzyme
MQEAPMISHLDHFVLTVASIERTCAFYEGVLGMKAITFGNGRKALAFSDQKINLHEAGREFEPKARQPTTGSADFCLITTIPLTEVTTHIQRLGISIEEGPVLRTGALGPIQSIYIRDPDENLIEIANYE